MTPSMLVIYGWLCIALAEVVVGLPLPTPLTMAAGAILLCASGLAGLLHASLLPGLPRWAKGWHAPSVCYGFLALLWVLPGTEVGLLQRALMLAGAIACCLVAARICAGLPFSLRIAPLFSALAAVAVVPLYYVLDAHVGWSSGSVTVARLATTVPWAVAVAVASAMLAVRSPRAALALNAVLVLFVPQITQWLQRSPSDGAKATSIIMISVDTLRADAAVGMATFKRLARRGISFTDTVSTASWTVPAIASIHTGLYPQRHGVRDSSLDARLPVLRPQTPTLAATLRSSGYETAAFVSNAWCDARVFGRGFETWHHTLGFPSAPLLFSVWGRRGDLSSIPANPEDSFQLTASALRWLQHRPGEPFFLWLHLLEPHLPYYQTQRAVGTSLEPLVSKGRLDVLSGIRSGRLKLDSDGKAALRHVYDEQVDYVDAALMHLLDEIESLSLPARTLIVFTSDHGEEFWEHGEFEHGHSLHDEVVRVPLVIVSPDGPAGVERDDPASLVDLMPTILRAVNRPVPEALDGVDLLAEVDRNRSRWLESTLYFQSIQGVIKERWKLVRSARELQLYDRFADPLESSAVGGQHLEVVKALEATLPDNAERAGFATTVDREALRALGYIE